MFGQRPRTLHHAAPSLTPSASLHALMNVHLNVSCRDYRVYMCVCVTDPLSVVYGNKNFRNGLWQRIRSLCLQLLLLLWLLLYVYFKEQLSNKAISCSFVLRFDYSAAFKVHFRSRFALWAV